MDADTTRSAAEAGQRGKGGKGGRYRLIAPAGGARSRRTTGTIMCRVAVTGGLMSAARAQLILSTGTDSGIATRWIITNAFLSVTFLGGFFFR